MSYYRGDYYAGGIGSFFGGLVKRVGSIAAGFIPGVGPTLSKAISAIPMGAAKSGAVASAAGAGMAIVKSGARAVGRGIVKHPVLSAAGAAGVAAGAIGGVTGRMTAPKMTVGADGSVVMHKKHRRMNIANGRALSRATRRLHMFAKRYRKVIGFVSPHKPKGRIYFKKKKRAA